MAVGCSMPVFRKQSISGTKAALGEPEAARLDQSSERPEGSGKPSFSSLHARFSTPRAENGPHHLAPGGATDSDHPRSQYTVAAAQGKGYELLAKAGYKGSGGLGPQESGITSPIPAWHNQGRMGIGSATTQQPTSSTHPASRAGDLSAREVTDGSEKGASSSRGASLQEEQQHQQPRKRSKPPHKDWGSVRVDEDLQVKVKRVKQVMRAEAEAAADKALAKALYREFNDVGGQHSADTNPLLRRSKLSASNPLR